MKRRALIFIALLAAVPLFPQPVRLLVVPFANGGAPGDAWLSPALEEALILDLGLTRGVRVVSREERRRTAEEMASPPAGKPDEAALRLGSAAGAAVVLSGRYRVDGADLAVTARLVSGGAAMSEVNVKRPVAQASGIEADIIAGLFAAAGGKKTGTAKLPVLTPGEIEAMRARAFSPPEFEYRGRELALEEPVSREFLEVEEAVFRSLNAERHKAGLAPFAYNRRLAALGRAHSRNMAEKNFFDVLDPDGLDGEGRRLKLAPELLGAVGQLIAFNYGGSPAELAAKLTRQWLGSSSREKLLDPDFNAVGVGAARGGEAGFRFYCTVVPAELWAELARPLPPKIAAGDRLSLLFRFAGAFPKKDLSIIVRFPDKTARVYKKDGTYTDGFGFYAPLDWQGVFFRVDFTCDKGRGASLIQAAHGDEFIPAGLPFMIE